MLSAAADPVTDERHNPYQIVVSWNAKIHGLYITLFVAISCSGWDLTIDANSQSAVASQLRWHIGGTRWRGFSPEPRRATWSRPNLVRFFFWLAAAATGTKPRLRHFRWFRESNFCRLLVIICVCLARKLESRQPQLALECLFVANFLPVAAATWFWEFIFSHLFTIFAIIFVLFSPRISSCSSLPRDFESLFFCRTSTIHVINFVWMFPNLDLRLSPAEFEFIFSANGLPLSVLLWSTNVLQNLK